MSSPKPKKTKQKNLKNEDDTLKSVRKKPNTRAVDALGVTAKGVTSLMPLSVPLAAPFIGPFNEIIGWLLVKNTNSKTAEWQEAVIEDLQEFYEWRKATDQKFDQLPQTLFQNDEFVANYNRLLFIATRTHQEEKRQYLRNSLINSLLPDAPSDDLEIIFWELIDTFTSWHVKILRLFDNHLVLSKEENIEIHGGAYADYLNQLILAVYPELHTLENRLLSHKISRDLRNNSFITFDLDGDGIDDSLTAGDPMDFITVVGKKFLKFIEKKDFSKLSF